MLGRHEKKHLARSDAKKAQQIGIKRTKNCRKIAKKVDANLAKISRNSVEKLSSFRWFFYREYIFLVLFQPCIAGCVHPCDGGGGAHCHMGLVAVCRCGRGACDDICSTEEVLYFSLIVNSRHKLKWHKAILYFTIS